MDLSKIPSELECFSHKCILFRLKKKTLLHVFTNNGSLIGKASKRKHAIHSKTLRKYQKASSKEPFTVLMSKLQQIRN